MKHLMQTKRFGKCLIRLHIGIINVSYDNLQKKMVEGFVKF